jgi:hypothetical protein
MEQASIGDKGKVIGMFQQPGSGLACVVIQREDGSMVFIPGDHRPIQHLTLLCYHRDVEVIEGEGSDFGCHSVKLDDDCDFLLN